MSCVLAKFRGTVLTICCCDLGEEVKTVCPVPSLTYCNTEHLADVIVTGFIECKQCKKGLKQALVRKLESRYMIS
jgi:hypothetical protein